MRYFLLVFLFFASLPVLTQNVTAQQIDTTAQRSLVRDIRIEGFVLGGKDQFIKLFKPHRNKYLTTSDMDGILQQIQQIYDQAGYQALVSINYHLDRKRLTFTVSLIK